MALWAIKLPITQLKLDWKFGAGGGEKGKFGVQKEKRRKVVPRIWVRIPQGNQTARTHARTDETERNDFPVGIATQPPMLLYE